MFNRQWLAERPYIIAIVISVLLIAWMSSGVMSAQELPPESEKDAIPVPKVKVETRYAQTMRNNVELYGRTEPDRIATVKAEVAGKIIKTYAQRGASVVEGEVIAEIAINDLKQQLSTSKALLKQRELQYHGAQKLNKDGYQGEVELSRAMAELEAVKADIVRLEIAISNTTIRAPFDGVLNTRYVEVGDYVKNGDDVAMVADLDPLIVRAHVTENQIDQLKVGQPADIFLLNREQAKGTIRYIASVADEATNTFKIEVAVDNKNNQLLAGLSGEVQVALEETQAIKVTPALLALDQHGNVGIKTVIDDIVHFTGIDIVKSESDGVWLGGLGSQADIIVLGQGFVRPGDKIEAVRAESNAVGALTSSNSNGAE